MDAYTHAGAVVVKYEDDIPFYLLVRAKEDATEWVLSKGHIEEGETPEDVALREVKEEAGIEGRILFYLNNMEYTSKAGEVNIAFFLIQCNVEVESEEKRELLWCKRDEALKLLTFEESRLLLGRADFLVSRIQKIE